MSGGVYTARGIERVIAEWSETGEEELWDVCVERWYVVFSVVRRCCAEIAKDVPIHVAVQC